MGIFDRMALKIGDPHCMSQYQSCGAWGGEGLLVDIPLRYISVSFAAYRTPFTHLKASSMYTD